MLYSGPDSSASFEARSRSGVVATLNIQGFQRIAPLFVPPLVQPIGHRPLEAVDLGFQRGVPCDLPLPPQPVLQAYFILNTSG
jgi:hypothetical protein